MTKGNGKVKAVARLSGDEPVAPAAREGEPAEGDVIQMLDHDGTPLWIKVDVIYDAPEGRAVRGMEFLSEEALPNQYVGWRALLLSARYDAAAAREVKRARRRASRSARPKGPGVCEHCGEPTKGGRFIPGHDAKLKGDLIREGTPEATAERVIRGWATFGDANGKPIVEEAKRVSELVAQGDGFLRSRIAARIGFDPGRKGDE